MNFLQNAQNKLISTTHKLGEKLTPVLKETLFEEKGVLTPQEFVAAGDQLVRTSPTWRWATGDVDKLRDYLPADKQYLVTKNVPCAKRVSTLTKEVEKATDTEVEGDWIATDTDKTLVQQTDETEAIPSVDDVETIGGDGAISSMKTDNHTGAVGREESEDKDTDDNGKSKEGDDDFINIDDFVEEDLVNDLAQKTTISAAGMGNLLKTRTYNVSIVYDKYYQTPRMFLEGYRDDGSPLSPNEIFEDVMQDYQNKTVTMERHPHLKSKILQASVHPCRHAKVMKKIINRLKEGGKQATPEQYLFIFLKFIQSVIPTVDYDYTIPVTAK